MFFSKKKKPEIRVKTRREKAFDYIKKLFFWLAGAFIVAVALEMFLLPNKIIDGGIIVDRVLINKKQIKEWLSKKEVEGYILTSQSLAALFYLNE